MKRFLTIGLAGLALLATAYLTLGGAGIQETDSAGLFLPGDQATVALGRELYARNCAACHGENLEGQVADWRSRGPDGLMPAPPHDETGHTWHHPDQVLFDITKFGIVAAANLKDYKTAMPIYEGVLSDEEIIAVLSFIKSTWPEEIRAGHDEMNARYALEPPETR
ncbi:cytochrome c [Hoeflea sp.]|uniref:c-type cytochrome n=1 Tax=Hoeflea sp. TaxID=1940281 RepID=UPI0025C2019A|nr:cytochrome c [Hoeflea sp.]